MIGTAGQGRNGEQSFVNIANGNLVLQDRDDVLIGRGLDVNAVRTYNSQGLLTDDNGDNWNVGAFGQKVVLTSGSVGIAGSTLTRTDRDGAQAVYTWDAAKNRYVSPAGSGAFDTIAYDSGASQFIWTDGDTGRIERYQSNGTGRLVSATDTDGNTVSYAYNTNGTVKSVTDANGDISYYDYSGTNLTQIRTVSGGVTTTTVHYAYDTSNRLFKVTVDLSPGDNTVADNNVYVTTYTYDGASKRVASVTQSDGTKLGFTYVQSGGVYKVDSVTDALGAVTRFAYDTAQNTTTVTDPLGAQSVYLYDAQGQLTQVRSGVTATNTSGLSQISYAYDATGNVTLVTDGEGHKVTLQYDDHGNLTREVDSAGDTRVRTYNGANQLLTDTIYADAAVVDRAVFNRDAALPETTRYVYAAGNPNQLRFAITPQGNVTEYRYDSYGQRTSTIKYAGAAYNTAALALTDVPTEAQLSSWATVQDRTRTELSELVYDARGQLSSSTTYASTAANGSGVAGTAATTQYIYDPRGLLLQKIEPATTAGGTTAVTTYTYDGLGRVLSVSAPSLDGGATSNTTTTSYDDANGKTSVTVASGLVTVSAYDKAGRLVSVTQQSAGTGVLGTTTYAYDKDGNLLMTQDPTGVRKWMLYDEADRKVAEIDATGAVIEYVYNANGQLRETVAYATRIGTAALVDGAGKPTTAWSATNTTTSLDALRPANTPQDQKVWRFYDTANRLTWQVDALGYVTQTTYDGASRILNVTQLANPIDVSLLGNGANIELLVNPATVGGITLGVDNANPAPLGSQVTLTATIEGVNPGGMVTFFSGETVVGSAMVVNGKATLVTNELPIGVNNIRAAYSGDVNRPVSLSTAAQKTITKAITSAVLSFSSAAPIQGEAVTLSATLSTLRAPMLTTAAGEVKFYNGSDLLGTATLINGVASIALSSLPAGNLRIRVEYAGDALHASILSEQIFAVAPKPVLTTTSIALGVSASSLEQGTPVTLTADVAGAAPSGQVDFFADSVFLGTAKAVNGRATLVTSYLPIGTKVVLSAAYAGDTKNKASFVAEGAAVRVASGSNSITPPSQSQTVTFTPYFGSNITGAKEPLLVYVYIPSKGTGSGTYSFFDGQTLIASFREQGGWLPYSLPGFDAGSHALKVVYSGDADSAAAVGTLDITIGREKSIIEVTSSRAAVVADGAVTFSVKVVSAQAGRPASGTATFYSNGQAIGTTDVVNGLASLTANNLSLGTLSITASYSGDDSHEPVLSNSLTQRVVGSPSPNSIGVQSSPATLEYGAPASLTAIPTGQGRPEGGSVDFYDGATLLGTASLVNGKAILTVSNLEVGVRTIKAVYSGDANNATSQITVNVTIARASSTLTNLTPPSLFKDSALSVRVEGKSPAGLVSFYSGTRLLGTAQVGTDGVATLSGVSLPPGTHTFSAAYAGDARNTDSSVSFGQVVEGHPLTTIYANLDLQQDRITSHFYNRDGQLQATLDAEYGLVEQVYDAAGRVVITIGHAHADRLINYYSKLTSAGNRMEAIAIARASYNLQGLRPGDLWQTALTYNYYDDQGRLVGQVDAEGYLTETAYDIRGNVVQTIRYAGKAWGAVAETSTLDELRPSLNKLQDRRVTQTWSAANQLLSRTDAEGTVTRFAYDSVGRLVQTTTAAGTSDERVTRSLYDIQGRLIGELDGRGSGAVALSDPFALWAANGLTHTYDAAGRRAGTTDANGHRTLFFYDAIGRLRYTVNALGEVTESRYSAMGQLTEQVIYGTPINVEILGTTAPGGLDTGAVADLLGLVANTTKDTHVLNGYNATGTKASTTDALGSTTSYSYNAFREAIASSYTLKNGYVVTDTATFDRRGLKIQTVQDTGTLRITQRKTYDAFGRVVESDDGNGNHTENTYDRLGRLLTILDPTRRITSETQYDAFDRVLRQKDANGAWESRNANSSNVGWTYFSYDLAKRSTTVHTTGLAVTTVRNRQGLTQSVADGRGNVTTYTYDKSGNLIGTDAPLGANTSATYDKTGLKLSSTDANGVRTDYTYDAANRLLTRTLDPTTSTSAGLNLVTTYAYDAKGQTVSVTDPRGIVTATEFDLAGQTLRQVVDPSGLRLTTSYTHDTTGKVLTVTDPSGNITQYTYDGAGRRIKEVVDPSSQTHAGLNLTRRYEYDAVGNVTRSVDANGNATRYAYDANSRLVYTLDPLGNLTYQEFDFAGHVLRRTAYAVPIATTGLSNTLRISDVQARVVATPGSDVVENRRYDGLGRLAQTIDGTGAVVRYTYDNADNLVETRTFANRVDPTSLSLIQGPWPVFDDTRDERVRTVYDTLNRAVWKVDGAGNVRRNIYDAKGNVVEVLAYANALTGAAFNSWDGQSAPAVMADAARDQSIRTVYDTANRAVWNVDTLGAVTQYAYDAHGNVVAKRSYSTPLTTAALAAWDGRTALAPVADDAHDQRVRNVYDAANRLVWSVDGIGAVSKTAYDANGNVTRRSQYATPIAEAADPASVTDSDADRVTDFLYDAGNRLRYQLRWTDTSELMSGAGWMREVTSYDYDGVGRLVRQTAHAWPLLSYVGNDIDSVFGNLSVAPGIDQAKYMVYDAAGRLSWSVDGTGAVTRNSYDGTGRVVRTVQYAQTVDVLGFRDGVINGYAIPQLTDSALQGLLRPDVSVDRITAFAHDGAGRRTFTVDALGSVTRAAHDAFGNVTQQVGYDTRIAPPSAASVYTDADLQTRTNATANAGTDRVQRFAYDQANRQVFAVDAQGGTTESIYDGLGQEVQTRRYARAIDVAGLSTTASAADIRARTAVDTVNDRVTLQVFNGGGQKIYGVDPMGFVSKTDYDGLGQVRGTTQYALSIPTNTANTAKAIADAIVTSPDDRSKSFQRDAVGRVLSTVDAMGFTESWSYDALGNKTSFTNAKHAVWTYGYDLQGRLVREVSPQVELTAVTPGGNGRLQVNAGASGAGNVVTVLAYDSFGNLRSRTEGAGRPEQRTTTYEYDQVGRQVKAIFPPVGVYGGESAAALAANGANGSATRVESVQSLFTETTYNALGNAVANRDIGGNYSYKTYDNLGRVAHEIDALGHVTGYERNTFGDVKTLTRFAAGTTLAASAAGNPTQAPSRDQVEATVSALRSDGANRTLRTDYDRLGRAIQVTEAETAGYDATLTTTQNFNAGKTTRNTYDSFGQLVQVAKLKDATAGTWALTTHFYDRRGQQTNSIDAGGYVTTQGFDAGGNVASRTEYANKLDTWAGLTTMAGWTGATNAGAAGTAPRPAANARDDRTTTTTYDRNNRKTSETRVNVEYSAASTASATRGNLTTVYEYDAVGNLTVTTDALGGRTVSYYDALGRVTAVAEPTRAGSDGVSPLTPLTVFRRDAHGNVVLKTEYINGADANGAALNPNPFPATTLVPNPEVASVEGMFILGNPAAPVWGKEGSLGYISSVPFEGSKPLYRGINKPFAKHYFTTDEAEWNAWLSIPGFEAEPVVGYVAGTPQPGTTKLYKLRLVDATFVDIVLTTNPAEVEALVSGSLGRTYTLDNEEIYVGTGPAGSFDAKLTRYFTAYNPLPAFVGLDHLYLTETIRVATDPQRDVDLLANTDRTSFTQYDALGHKVQTTDAMGVNHYSSYNSQGLVAKDWQGVSGNDGATRTLFRAYAYDALGQQTHVYDPGNATDNADATQGGARGIYTTNPKATVTPAPSPGSISGGDLPGRPVDNGKLALQLANVVNAQGGAVRVQFDYVMHPTSSPGDENTPAAVIPGRAGTFAQDFQSAATAAQGVTLSPEEPMASVSAVRIFQEQGPGNWVLLWQGAPAQADGQTNASPAAGASGAPVDTAMAYNAFGELVAKSVNGQAGEYFDYNNAGQLWRTNAGDGVDKVALYDLLGNQSADIRSAGKARGDLNLRAYGTAAEVRDLVDVRRTNTSYDLLGRVTQQALAERWTDSQGGVTAQTGKLGIAVVDGSGNNRVALSWPGVLEGLGGGDVQVTLHYTRRDANGAETGATSRSVTVGALEAANGYTMVWADASGAEPSGVARVTHVTVQKRDLLGDWQTVVNQDGAGNAGRSVRIDAPGTPAGPPPGAQINLQWRVAGSPGDSGWVGAPLANFGDSLRFDASALGEGSYEYRVFTALMNQPATVTASGVLSVTPPVLSSFSANGNVNAPAQTFDWQSPGGGDTQVIRLRQVGTATWYEQAISQNGGTSSISLANLPGDATYEYELLWSHAGDVGPYAHATGQIYKKAAVAGTPDIPGTPERTVSLPHIDGVTVEKREESIWTDENGNDRTRTVWVVRLPPPPLGLVSRVGMRVNGDGLPLLLMQQRQWPPSRPDGYDEFVVTDSSILLRGLVYEFVYTYSPIHNAEATQHTSGKLTYFPDGSVQFEDTTPPMQVIPATPGIPGTPGTPAQYAYTGTTPESPYAISQDRWLGGPQLHIGQALNGSGAGYVRPVVTQNTDRWGNVVSITDPRSSAWKTTYRYNANNQLVQQVQTDSDGNAGADANGNVVNANAPVTQIYFDALGRQVAVRDARDNVNVQVWDAGGKLVQERHADGGVIDHRFNAFGNEVATVDARRKTTTSTYDKLDRLVRTVRPAVGVYTSGFGLGGVVATDLGTRNLQETQRWDQAGRKLSQTNANNETVKYAYDLRGNLVSTTQLRAEGSATPERLATIAAYDARNHKIIEVDANGSDTTWRYDYFGQLQARTDLGKTGYGYSYDNARQLSQISGGQGQTMHYDAAGQLVRIDDTRVGTTSTYAYDLGGRRLRETTIHNGAVYQDNAIAYDALGRMRWVADTRAYVSIDYDKAGNRTRVTTKARDVGVQANSDTAYTYDAMNRQLTAGSHTFAYDANGNRTSDTDSAAGGINESYDYDALNRLTRTSRSDGTFEARAYDAASRVVQTAEEGSIKSDDYDDNGRLVASTQLKGTASALSGSNTTIYFYDAAGNAVNSLYVDSGSNASSHTHTTYVAGPQGYQQKTSTTVNARGAIQIDGSTGNTTGQVLNGAASTTGSVTHHYDANGNKHLIVNDFE
ncbi:YD repeat-containing protein, partial [Variovorax boronicumulans]|uniref:Ig-like domain repeat protein n=1 Tax=Variovorax boronicumulans TaxID=436515 RepID=UPI00277E6854